MIFAVRPFPEVKREETAVLVAATARRNRIGPRPCAVSHLVGAAIKHSRLFFDDRLVERQRFGLEVALRHIFRREVTVSVLAAHQRRPIPLADRASMRRHFVPKRDSSRSTSLTSLRDVSSESW